jgi:RNA polymerase sigma-70 factor, ECF subfamily
MLRANILLTQVKVSQGNPRTPGGRRPTAGQCVAWLSAYRVTLAANQGDLVAVIPPGCHAGEAEDRELAEALASRRRDHVLDVLFRRHATRVYRFCVRIVGNPAVAEEVAQEAFVKTMGCVGWLRRPAPPTLRAYLYRTAHRLAVSQARRHSAERRALERLERQPAPAATDGGGVDAQRVREALGRIGDAERAVLLLWAEAELTLAEVARVLELPESTCRDHFRQALDSLAVGLGCDRAAPPVRGALARVRPTTPPAAAVMTVALACLDPER